MTISIDEIIQWARGAGDILRAGYGKTHQVNNKGRIDLVTEIDHQSEAYLIAKIRARFPDHPINSEESGLLNGKSDSCWYVDPVDGTTNYAHSLPFFCVSIAYAENGILQAGVVYDPMMDECFSAVKGQGAFLNGQPIHVSDAQTLVTSLLTTGFPYSMQVIEGNLVNFAHFSRLTQGVRRLGSAALDLCYVASGRVDGYWEISLQSYDMAAGALIVSEAGGIITNLQGNADYFKSPFAVLAATPAVHPLMVAEFHKLSSLQEANQ